MMMKRNEFYLVLDRDRDRDFEIPYLDFMKQDSIDIILRLAIVVSSSESV